MGRDDMFQWEAANGKDVWISHSEVEDIAIDAGDDRLVDEMDDDSLETYINRLLGE